MSPNARTLKADPTSDATRQGGPPGEIAELLTRVNRTLEDEQPEKAIELIVRSKINSTWAINALGVCQLRLGNSKTAIDIFRGLALASGGVSLRQDVPTVFQTNFATALLLNDNMNGCLSVLRDIRGDEHHSVRKLRDAFKRWKAGLTTLEKFMWYFGSQPARPFVMDSAPGDLE